MMNTFEDKLNELFDIAHSNALNTIKIHEDKLFLIIQREKGRHGCMMGIDSKLTSLEFRKSYLQEQKVRQKEKHEIASKSPVVSIDYISDENFTDEEEIINIESVGPSKIKRARKEIINHRLSAALNKCKISDRDAVHLLTAAAESINVNTSEYIINRSSIKRAREKCREQLSEAIKSNFLNVNLQYCVVHWDSKLLPGLTGRDTIDRLPVIITAPNVEQLLGVPQLSSGRGNEICSAVYNTLDDWGRLNGACVLLEQKLNRNILFLDCHHHIFEIILQAVFVTSKLSVMSGPDIPLFKRFKNNWVNLDLRNFHTWTSHPDVFEELKYVVDDVLLFCTKRIEENYPRDDYKEFIELIIFLGKTPPRGIHFRPPGAYHLARWMAKGIYCFKMLLFYQQFKLSVIEKRGLKEVCCFIVECYLEAWICAPDPITAPLNDIIILKKLVDYTKYNKKNRRIFSLFDDRIDNNTKSKMAKRILEINEEGINADDQEKDSQKKIVLQFDDVQHFLCKDLPLELISNKSIQFFQRFCISKDFLHKDPSLWNITTEYKEAKDVITTLKVVNDSVERGVKLMEEFNDKFTKQYVLQIFQDYRKQYPGFSRKVLKQTYNK
ncbi:hypothetical protein AGLY_016815 [Aphis glycines]|uniref:Uncharacterized protein n=1 Tax=Aphis glycines TaxID=307491 RepID=A0A6G0SXU1_APHGL|nr:hypothetical protein AGLY_016815 [Aphis glycines]